VKKGLLFVLLVGLHLLLAHASFNLCERLAERPGEERSAFRETLARVGVEVTWRPLLLPLYDRMRIGGERFVDVQRNLSVAANSTVAVSLGFLGWWTIRRVYQVLRNLCRSH